MTADAWLAAFVESTDVSGLRNAAARDVVTYLQRYGAAAGKFVEARRRADAELVILDLYTGVPQRPVYPIHHSERVGIFFHKDSAQPLVVMLRNNFPDTEHQQLVPSDVP